MSQLLDRLRDLREERIRTRRQVCAQIRENKEWLKDDGWIMHKINGRYLGDLSDIHLVNYGEKRIRMKDERQLETR